MPHSSPLHFVAPSRNQDHSARVDQQERPQGICVNVCKIIPEQSPLSSTERYRPWGSSSWYHPFSLIGEKSFVGFSMSEARLSLVYGSPTGPRPRRPMTRDARCARDPENTRSAHHPSARGCAALARDNACTRYATAAHCCGYHASQATLLLPACVSMRCDFPSILAQTSLAGAPHTFKPSNLATTQKATPAAATPAAATPTAATPAAATPATIPAAARRCHRPPLPPPDRPPRRCDAHRCNARRDRTSNPLPKRGEGVRVHLLSSLGTFVIRIRILKYPDVS